MQFNMTLYTYNQFRSFASSRIDLYAFNNPCSERSTLTFVISVVGGFVIRERMLAASVSRIILSVNVFSVKADTHHHKSRQCIERRDRSSREYFVYLPSYCILISIKLNQINTLEERPNNLLMLLPLDKALFHSPRLLQRHTSSHRHPAYTQPIYCQTVSH